MAATRKTIPIARKLAGTASCNVSMARRANGRARFVTRPHRMRPTFALPNARTMAIGVPRRCYQETRRTVTPYVLECPSSPWSTATVAARKEPVRAEIAIAYRFAATGYAKDMKNATAIPTVTTSVYRCLRPSNADASRVSTFVIRRSEQNVTSACVQAVFQKRKVVMPAGLRISPSAARMLCYVVIVRVAWASVVLQAAVSTPSRERQKPPISYLSYWRCRTPIRLWDAPWQWALALTVAVVKCVIRNQVSRACLPFLRPFLAKQTS